MFIVDVILKLGRVAISAAGRFSTHRSGRQLLVNDVMPMNLRQLHESGQLSDEEYARIKASAAKRLCEGAEQPSNRRDLNTK